MAALILFFPVTSTFFDGLRRTDQGLVDIALINRASPLRIQNAAAIAVASTATPRTMRIADWFKEMTAFLFPRRSRSREQSS